MNSSASAALHRVRQTHRSNQHLAARKWQRATHLSRYSATARKYGERSKPVTCAEGNASASARVLRPAEHPRSSALCFTRAPRCREKSCTWEAVSHNRKHVLLLSGSRQLSRQAPLRARQCIIHQGAFYNSLVFQVSRKTQVHSRAWPQQHQSGFYDECFLQTLVCAMGSLHLDGCVDVAAQLGLRLFRRKDLVGEGAQCHRVRGRLHLERCQPIQVALLICMKLLHVVVRIFHAPVLNLFLDAKHLQTHVRHVRI